MAKKNAMEKKVMLPTVLCLLKIGSNCRSPSPQFVASDSQTQFPCFSLPPRHVMYANLISPSIMSFGYFMSHEIQFLCNLKISTFHSPLKWLPPHFQRHYILYIYKLCPLFVQDLFFQLTLLFRTDICCQYIVWLYI